MLSFENDYTEGAHPKILERLMETNMEKLSGYGSDRYCESAREKIRAACGCPGADVHFLVGGTQTNEVVIATMLGSCEGVVAARTGHVSVHANPEHMVFPGMVYISHPTEYGTLYTKEELKAISEVCQEYGIPLYMDGARLGYGLASRETDVTLPDIAKLCDVFYIGGTKVGALCGEAVVFTKNNTPKHFMSAVKRHGALLAKGRLLGIQFDVLFTGGLYQEISRNAIGTAERLKQVFHEKGCRFYLESPTNQQFVILENSQMEKLAEQVRFSFWETYDESHTVVRFATSWATRMEDVEKLAELL